MLGLGNKNMVDSLTFNFEDLFNGLKAALELAEEMRRKKEEEERERRERRGGRTSSLPLRSSLITDNTSLWIVNSGCQLSGYALLPLSPLFIPFLTHTQVAQLNPTSSSLSLILTGQLLVPCNLSCLILFVDGSNMTKQLVSNQSPIYGKAR